MAKKKSVRLAADNFVVDAENIAAFASQVSGSISDQHKSWVYDYAIIRLYREFERLMLAALTGAINNDTSTVSSMLGINFPKHLTDEVCVYLITGGGYFDFKGRDGLIKKIKDFVPDNHYLLTTVRKQTYRDALNRLSALRNFAAHDSSQSKKAALTSLSCSNLSSSGSWLKRQGRFQALVTSLQSLAQEIRTHAPY